MSPSLSQFPDLCLLGMFKHIPLVEVIGTVRLVCKNWARVQRDELKRRRSLVINYSKRWNNRSDNPYGSELIVHVKREDGSPWMKVPSLDQIQFNAIQTCSNMFTDLVMNIMPNITHLTIERYTMLDDYTISFLVQMIRLFQHYSTKLLSLVLDWTFYESESTTDAVHDDFLNKMVALFDSINQLQSLQHLQLDISSCDTDLSVMLPQVKLSILPRLNTFTSRSNKQFFINSLREYATDNVRLVWGARFTFDEMFKLNPRVKFIRVGVWNGLDQNDYSEMHLFCSRFTLLQTLQLSISKMSMTMLARCLSQLSQLVHLKLYFKFIEEEQMPLPDIVQVLSVRLLTIDISFESHLQCEKHHLVEIFPNLQVLSVYYSDVSCIDCEYDTPITYYAIEPNLRPRIEHCMRLARQPFRRCANLHTVKLDALGSLRDLLPQDLITVDQL